MDAEQVKLEGVESIWACPKCGDSMVEDGQSLVCSLGHRYDRAKQGYVNLLLANQKKSKSPGDSAEMMSARRAFLAAGYYQPLINRLTENIEKLVKENGYKNIVDIGCGEGSYLKALRESSIIASQQCYGVDISKPAVAKAAPHVKSVSFAVASSANLPFRSQSVDLAISVFSPIFSKEIQRILSHQGLFIRVLPGERHLYELKEKIFDQVRLHKPVIPEDCFTVLEEVNVEFMLAIRSKEDLTALLTMIPLSWRAKAEGKAQALLEEQLHIQADFVLQILSVGTG